MYNLRYKDKIFKNWQMKLLKSSCFCETKLFILLSEIKRTWWIMNKDVHLFKQIKYNLLNRMKCNSSLTCTWCICHFTILIWYLQPPQALWGSTPPLPQWCVACCLPLAGGPAVIYVIPCNFLLLSEVVAGRRQQNRLKDPSLFDLSQLHASLWRK